MQQGGVPVHAYHSALEEPTAWRERMTRCAHPFNVGKLLQTHRQPEATQAAQYIALIVTSFGYSLIPYARPTKLVLFSASFRDFETGIQRHASLYLRNITLMTTACSGGVTAS